MKYRWHPRQALREYWTHLRQMRDAPPAIAGGVAIGIFWGFTPLTGLKTLLSIFTAWLFRCSKIPAVITVALHDVLIPVWPVILRWEYDLGYWICAYPHRFPERFSVRQIRLAQLFDWKTLKLLWPTFLGSCVIGIPIAVAAYWLVKDAAGTATNSKHGRAFATSGVTRIGIRRLIEWRTVK